MKQLSFILAALLFAVLNVYSQEEPASAVPLTETYYLEQLLNNPACNSLALSLGASGSGMPTCAGVDNNDVWISTTATYQGSKYSLETSNFDAVIYVYDASFNLIACENSNGANAGEEIWVTDLVAGDNYYIRVHSFDGSAGDFTLCGWYLPRSELRNGWSPYPSGDSAPLGYRVTEWTKRRNYAPYNNLIQGTRWEFTNVDTGVITQYEITGNNGNLTLSLLDDMCFGQSYTVRVQVRVDDNWCGYGESLPLLTEAEPTTRLQDGYGGNTYGVSSNIKVNFVGPDQLIEWRFTSNNGAEVLQHFSTSSTISMDEIACIRYNRIYTVEVRVTYCGQTGPWSDADFLIISPLPYTRVTDQYCNTVQFPGATLFTEFINVADQYAWQIAEIDPDDPLLTPVAPAIVTYSPSTNLYLLPLGLEWGKTYRIGVKPFLGFTGDCDTFQEGDYGQFCSITIGDPSALMAPPMLSATDDETGELIQGTDEQLELLAYPNPMSSGDILKLQVKGTSLSPDARLKVFSGNGMVLIDDLVSNFLQGNTIELMSSSNWARGMYFVQVQDARKSLSTNVLLK